MTYTYDRSASDTDWQERQSDLGDAIRAIEEVVEALGKDPNDELGEHSKLAQEILDDLRTAESVEKEADFDANVVEADKKLKQLKERLGEAKRKAKKDEDLTETVEAIDEALEWFRELGRELGNLLPEG